MLQRPSGAAHLGLAVLVLSAGDSLVNERLLEILRSSDVTPRPVGLWEQLETQPLLWFEDVEVDGRYL